MQKVYKKGLGIQITVIILGVLVMVGGGFLYETVIDYIILSITGIPFYGQYGLDLVLGL
ncbi:MAG: hypothetical protein ACM3MK_00030 [Chitinophagales bacterium]